MAKTIIQIPVEKKLRDEAEHEATKQGFSSLQEVMRLFLRQFIDKKMTFGFVEPAVVLSKKNAARYDKMKKDFEEGKNFQKANTVDEFMDQLGV